MSRVTPSYTLHAAKPPPSGADASTTCATNTWSTRSRSILNATTTSTSMMTETIYMYGDQA